MVQIIGLKKIKAKLDSMADKEEPRTVIVGYEGVNYAIYVHEDMNAHHPVGQAKFLEQPARTEQKKMAKDLKKLVEQGIPLEKALLIIGQYLQRKSMELVPIDTGNLKGSAFTDFENARE